MKRTCGERTGKHWKVPQAMMVLAGKGRRASAERNGGKVWKEGSKNATEDEIKEAAVERGLIFFRLTTGMKSNLWMLHRRRHKSADRPQVVTHHGNASITVCLAWVGRRGDRSRIGECQQYASPPPHRIRRWSRCLSAHRDAPNPKAEGKSNHTQYLKHTSPSVYISARGNMMLGFNYSLILSEPVRGCLSRCHVLVSAWVCPLERTLGKRDNLEMVLTYNFVCMCSKK